MNNIILVLILAGTAGACYYYLKKRNVLEVPVKIEVYTSITLTDIVSMLKLEHPDPNRHKPYIGTIEILKDFKHSSLQFPPAPDQTPVVIGIYDSQTEKITYVKVLYVKDMDDAAKSVFEKAKESIVILE